MLLPLKDKLLYSTTAVPDFNDFDHIPTTAELFTKLSHILDTHNQLYTTNNDGIKTTVLTRFAKYIPQQQNDPKVSYASLYGLPKVHKLPDDYVQEDISLRHICPNINTVTCRTMLLNSYILNVNQL